MSDFLKQKLNKKEQIKANWGCLWCILFVFLFWSGLIYWAVNIYLN